MSAVDPALLVGRLNDVCRRALEAAVGNAVALTHYNIELEHYLLALLDRQHADIGVILSHVRIDPDRLALDLTRALDRMRRGSARLPSLAPEIGQWLQQAWLFGSIQHGAAAIRSGHLLVALLSEAPLARHAREASALLADISVERLTAEFAAAVDGSEEAETAASAPRPAAPAATGEGLDRFTIDLVARARAGRIDPVLGRDAEIRQAADILLRRRQNNPILTGEAGVGKTAVVEGLALRIAAGDMPPALRDVELRTLDLGLLQAGASAKGEFEARLKSVIDAVQASPRPVILFIDEAHTLIGAGGQQGQNDAANLLKPALARGELRMVAATTWAEYKKYFEKDAALTRRFQVVKVEEPSEPVATAMLRGLVDTLEAHHGVRVLDEALSAAVHLSARFIPARQLPDKAVSLLDTACARVAMSQTAVPPAVEDRRRRLALIEAERRILGREAAAGDDHAEREDALAAERHDTEAELAALEARWEEEKRLVAAVTAARDAAEAASGTAAAEVPRSRLAEERTALRALQGEAPLVFPVVDAQAVAEVVHGWTGIPAGRMRSDEIRSVLTLREALGQRIIGQPHALEAVAEAIQTSRAKLTDPRKPIGVFLMVGTSGTGKTETALALADLLYGGEQSLTIINMTEFKEEHKVSLLMGSPPGYVGYGEGGILTEAVRRRPYSVILLDEMEKAHPGVQDVFFQVFDKGTMKDGEGRDVDFKNTVIVMTSNAGTDLISRLFADAGRAPGVAEVSAALRPALEQYFKPAFLARTTLVPYLPLSAAVIRSIVGLQLRRVGERIRTAYRASFTWEPEVASAIAERCTESASGARNVENILSRTLLPQLSSALLSRLAEGNSVSSVNVCLDEGVSFRYEIT
jgi:type VI secretion system protein VasG